MRSDAGKKSTLTHTPRHTRAAASAANVERPSDAETSGFRPASAGINQHGTPTKVLHLMDTAKSGVSNAGITVTIDEARDVCDGVLHAIVANPEHLQTIPTVMMWSAPGVGKTSIAEAIAKRHGIDFIDFRLGQCEPQDVGGIRIPDLETGRLKRYIPNEYPDPNRKGYCPQGIIFLDELTTADKALQSAALGLTNERHLGKETYVVPDGYGIFAAGNPKGVGAHSLTMAAPLANRMLHLEIEADPASLVKFFRERGGPAERALAKIPPDERRAAFRTHCCCDKIGSENK